MHESGVPVLIAGGGPRGLMLANELGRRGIGALLVHEKLSTASNPQANATQERTMEHFRRLGLAEEIRSLGLPLVDGRGEFAFHTQLRSHEDAETLVGCVSGDLRASA